MSAGKKKKRAPAGAGRRARARAGATTKEAAAHFGVAKNAVQEWGQKGWIVRHPDRSIDLEATAIRVEEMRDPRRGGKPDRGSNLETMGEADGKSTKRDGDALPDVETAEDAAKAAKEKAPAPAGITLGEANRRKVYWQAVRAHLEAEEKAGRLVDLETIKLAWAKSGRVVKSRLQGLPPSLATELVASGHGDNINAIEDVIARAIEVVLTELSDEPPTQ